MDSSTVENEVTRSDSSSCEQTNLRRKLLVDECLQTTIPCILTHLQLFIGESLYSMNKEQFYNCHLLRDVNILKLYYHKSTFEVQNKEVNVKELYEIENT